jgi:ATP:ADP antiporter, AAA family
MQFKHLDKFVPPMIKKQLQQLIFKVVHIKPNELKATLLSFCFVFLLMTAYFILRPLRDAMSSDWPDPELSWLWTSTFFFSFIAVTLHGAIISRVKLKYVVPGVYIFFSLSFVLFYLFAAVIPDPDFLNKCFYVWLSVFSLFHVSVFWSFISNLFSTEQAPRLFSFIASGASIGAIIGPTIPILFASDLGVMNLLLIAAGILLLPVPIINYLESLKTTELGNKNLDTQRSNKKLERDLLSGFMTLIKDPYLVSIGIFILLYVAMNTFVYFELRKFLIDFDRDTRTQIWASIDLAVNLLAITTAIFATSRITKRFGMPMTLAIIPLLMIVGWMAVAVSPILMVLIGLQIIRRAGNYAITKPGREMLFTMVSNEARYKAKPVIDIVIYRGGDMLTAWFYTLLTASFGLGLNLIALIASCLAGLWAFTGVYLGRKYNNQNDVVI